MENRTEGYIAIILALGTIGRVKLKRWMKEWLKKREEYSHLVLLKEISLSDVEDFKNYFRMEESPFKKLIQIVEPFLKWEDTNMRERKISLNPEILGHGGNFEDLKFSVIMPPATISAAVVETRETLTYVLQDYMKFSTTASEWDCDNKGTSSSELQLLRAWLATTVDMARLATSVDTTQLATIFDMTQLATVVDTPQIATTVDTTQLARTIDTTQLVTTRPLSLTFSRANENSHFLLLDKAGQHWRVFNTAVPRSEASRRVATKPWCTTYSRANKMSYVTKGQYCFNPLYSHHHLTSHRDSRCRDQQPTSPPRDFLMFHHDSRCRDFMLPRDSRCRDFMSPRDSRCRDFMSPRDSRCQDFMSPRDSRCQDFMFHRD
uniref:Uncharacterized protein n=1 Tax=Timema bartmani TaxID=61472 RepID=A0A7R9I4M9_9NEOP|nr:unnamed protein product [Timema bartmani]